MKKPQKVFVGATLPLVLSTYITTRSLKIYFVPLGANVLKNVSNLRSETTKKMSLYWGHFTISAKHIYHN